jgi:plastocyanin
MMRATRTAACVVSLLSCLLVAGCGGGGGDGKNETVTISAPSGGGPATLTVDAEDVFFKPKTVKAPAGKIDIHYVEQGSQLHTLLIEGVKDFKLSVGPDARSDDGIVDLAPGKYDFYCDVAGHRAQGMEGTITVAS